MVRAPDARPGGLQIIPQTSHAGSMHDIVYHISSHFQSIFFGEPAGIRYHEIIPPTVPPAAHMANAMTIC